MTITRWGLSTRPLRGGYTTGYEQINDLNDALEAFLNRVTYAIGESCDTCSPLYKEFVVEREETREAFRGYLMGDPYRNIAPAHVLKAVVEMVGVPWLVVLAREVTP